MKDSLKLGMILFLITAICTGLLGAVNQITTPIIDRNNITAEQEAMKALLTDATDFTQIEDITDETIKKLFIATSGDSCVGYIVKMEPVGYGGAMAVLIGLNAEKKVEGIQILSHSETPGFGANATKDSFLMQFQDRSVPLEVVKTTPQENEVEAITGATITSKAIVDSVNAAAAFVNEHQEEWGTMQ